MTLDSLANFICRKVNQTEAEDIAACKGFLTQRHEIIWTEELWKDSLVEYLTTVTPTGYTPASNWLPTKGVLIVPGIIEEVIAVRSDQRALSVQRPELYYRIDYDAFAKTGLASDFITLPACVWETDVDCAFDIYRANLGDNQLVVKADALNSDLTGITRQTLTMDQATRDLGTTQRIDTVLKKASTGALSLQARLTGDLIAAGSSYNAATNLDGHNPFQVGDTIQPYRVLTGFTIGNSYDYVPGTAVSLNDANGAVLTAAGTFVATQTSYTLYAPTYVYAGIPEIHSIDATINPHLYDVVTVAAADTGAARRQRIRLVQIPTATLTLRVLGKRSVPSFEDDNDEPGISNAANFLIAAGQADMLERERQYGKAATKRQEAAALLDQLKRVQVVQQAHNSRIIPQGGYGDEHLHRMPGFSF